MHGTVDGDGPVSRPVNGAPTRARASGGGSTLCRARERRRGPARVDADRHTMARIRAHRRAPAHDVHVLARWRGSMADRGDTDRLAVVSVNDVAGRRTHRPWRSRATDARSPVSGAVGN